MKATYVDWYGGKKQTARDTRRQHFSSIPGNGLSTIMESLHLDNDSNGVPLYLRVAETFRRKILSGELADGEKLPPEATLASMLGINHQTLRKGFAILGAQKLITQCKGRGTFVHLANTQHMRIGVLVSELAQFSEDLYVLRMLAALNGVMSEKYHGELILLSVCTPGELLPRINQTHCDGIIVLYADGAVRRRLCQKDFDHFPMVFVNAQTPNLAEHRRYEVRMADDMAERAVDALYRQGHRKIGLVSCSDRRNFRLSIHNRKFLQSCTSRGLSTQYVKLGNSCTSSGYTANWFSQANALAYELCTRSEHPTAIFCPGYTFSCGTWQGIMEAGLHIPDDMAFIGFDANANVNPNMSALLHPVRKIAEKTMEILFHFHESGKHTKILCYEYPAEFNHPNRPSF